MLPRLFVTAAILCATHGTIIVSAMEAIGGTLCNTHDSKKSLSKEIVKSRDATIFEGQDEISSARDLFMTGSTKNGIRRGLLAFDIEEDDFPYDAKVECAEIRLHVDSTSDYDGGAYDIGIGRSTLHRITAAWKTSGENLLQGVNGGNVRTGDATWSYAAYPTSKWGRKGGDYDVENVVATREEGGKIHWYGGTLTMARIVQEWIDVKSNPFNGGFMLIGEESAADSGSESYVKYSGAENAPDLIPRLIVTYTSPSQGRKHREYSSYLPEVPHSAALHNDVITSGSSYTEIADKTLNDNKNESTTPNTFVLVFVGGLIIGSMMGLLVGLYLKHSKNVREREALANKRDPAVMNMFMEDDEVPDGVPPIS
mmetsp:Transcript_5648/g.11040  ORF Transcript_5648/g.11040 Transcript_5648/m.11040 type:complete len:369 (+) Transcript_5648:274-1380(+)